MADKFVTSNHTGTVVSYSITHGTVTQITVEIKPDNGGANIRITDQANTTYKKGEKINYSEVKNTTKGTSFYTTLPV